MASPVQYTPYMNMLLPAVGVENGFVAILNTDFATIDIHDHYEYGKGLSEKSINWLDFDLELHSIVNAGSVGFTPLSTLSAIVPLSLYFYSSDGSDNLYFTDGAAHNIQITNAGAVNFSVLINGFYGDFVRYGASVVYTSLTNTYQFNTASGLGNLGVGTLTIYNSLVVPALITPLLTPFTITSTRYFPENCVLCAEGAPLLQIKAESQNITDILGTNPRLIQNVNQLNNLYADQLRSTRFNVNNTNVVVNVPTGTIPAGTCVIDIVIGTSGNPGGVSYQNIMDFHNPASEESLQSTTSYVHQVGAITSVTPTFVNNVGYVLVTATYNAGVPFPTTLMEAANKTFNLNFVFQSGIYPTLTQFQEYHSFVANGNIYTYYAYYVFQIVDTITGIPTQAYTCTVRI